MVHKFENFIIGIPEGNKKKKRTENIFKAIMVEKFPHLGEKYTFRPKRSKSAQVGCTWVGYTKTHYEQIVRVKDKELWKQQEKREVI